ncbi:hypothetical protein VTH06DRAFT_7076 [Thermothelomyces fergusii]
MRRANAQAHLRNPLGAKEYSILGRFHTHTQTHTNNPRPALFLLPPLYRKLAAADEMTTDSSRVLFLPRRPLQISEDATNPTRS